jgi:hypothetical protein
MGKALEHILVKYPEFGALIIDLYRKDEDFRILCEDFLANIESLGACKLNMAKDIELESELLQLNLDLEKEIIRLLKRMVK